MSDRHEELAALIADQEADAQWGDRINFKRERSLDAPLGHDANAGTLAEVVGADDRNLTSLVGGAATATRRIPRPQKWTKREIVKHIRAWVKEHGEPPGCDEWNAPRGRGFPSSASLTRKFGTFNDAIRAAGFEPRPQGGPRSPVQGTRLRPRIDKRHSDAFLTTEQIAAAYVLYDRQRLSINEIADKLWQRYGYKSPNVCRTALQRAFHAEGFRLRTKSEARMCLPEAKRKEIARAMAAGRAARRAA